MRLLPSLLILICFTVISLAVVSFGQEQMPAALFGGAEVASPGNWIQEENISVYSDKVIINISNPLWAKFSDTNSMDPFLDAESNAIEILPPDPELIKVGDVIAYQTVSGTVIHRVVEKKYDERGIYFRVKGDNNTLTDPLKVRYSDITGVVVAIIY